MTWLEQAKHRRRLRQEQRREIDRKVARGFEQGIKLEKGDLFAIVIAGLFNFVMPIMLLIGAICGMAYLWVMCF
ncbi:MAG: hypothetical protein U0J65_09645 [Christensenellales bacterium]|nr:hypothetical protein [Christensenellales bacterium]